MPAGRLGIHTRVKSCGNKLDCGKVDVRWFPTHAFHGVYLLTKWTLHIDLRHYELSEKNKQVIRQSLS